MGSWIAKFRLKAWHFCIPLVLVFIITCVVEYYDSSDVTGEETSDRQLEELDVKSMSDTEKEDLNFVLAYTPDCHRCVKMENLLIEISQDNTDKAGFFKIDISKNPDMMYEYNISGVPCIIVFKDNKEVNRIMGVISHKNLNMIYHRVAG